MTWHTVFDIATAGYRAWWLPLYPLALCFLAAWWGRSWHVPPFAPGRASQRAAAGFFLFMAIVAAVLPYTSYRVLLHAREAGDVRVVQGVVTDFHPGDLLIHKRESFRVGNEWIGYSAFDLRGGYNRVASTGGSVRSGDRVRASLVGDEIVKLEIAGQEMFPRRSSELRPGGPLLFAVLTETERQRGTAPRPSEYFHDPRVAELALVATSGQVSRVRELVAAGVDPNARGDQGVTPLLWATALGNAAGVAALMQAGANATLGDDRTRTPLVMAIDHHEDAALLRVMLEHGAPVNFVVPKRNETLLMCATMMAHPEQVRYLIQAGADVSWQDSVGDTALSRGALPNTYRCALILLDAGADPLHRDHGGVSLVDLLAIGGDPGTLTQWAQEDRARLLAWLWAHDVPLVTRRGEVIGR